MLAANLVSFLSYASLAVVGETGAGASECDGGQADRENCRGADPGTAVGRGADGPGPGLRRLIDHAPGIDVADEAGTGAEAVQLCRDTDPDVVVMDIRMPGIDGIEATQLITAGDTRPRVLVLTTFDDDDYVYGALRAGASGFLVKDMALEDILAAIRVVAAGDAMSAPGVTRRLIGQFAGQARPGRKPVELTGITDREREVLRLVGLGMSNTEIAAAPYITVGTAKTHVARLLAKLGARDRVQLVITAYETGLVSARADRTKPTRRPRTPVG
jgi:DNA-binding NarL/FixJ family response regulator